MPISSELSGLFLYLIVGFVAGLFASTLVARNRLKAARLAGRQELAAELATLQERLTGREEQLSNQRNELLATRRKLDDLISEKNDLEKQNVQLQTEQQEQRRHSEENVQILNETKQALHLQFENLANQIFEEKTKVFANQSQANLNTVLAPFKEKIVEFEKKVTDIYSTEGRERHSLMNEVQRLQELNRKLGEDAENLTKALKGDVRTQGAWGEVILERILEESGLRKGMEYDSQGGFRDAQGKLLKPDVIVHLPEEKDIIIDSKVSLLAYEKYVRSEDEAEREQAAREHQMSVNAHLKGLTSKKYDDLPGVKSLDFVLMFVPIEGAFMLSVERDGDIFRKAFDQNIMIVSPSTLLVTLRTIQNIWRYEYQNKNALEIAEKAGNLYDKFVSFVGDLEKIGEQLSSTQKTYNGAHNKLVSGKGNLISKAQTLIDLGVKSRKKLMSSALRKAEEDES